MPLHRAVKAALDKQLLKKQRLSDDLLNAENSEKYRLYGELLTANIHRLRGGETGITVNNYYNGENINITLDPKLSPAANAQKYYKKYSKSKRAVTEKRIRLGDTDSEIAYLESVLLSIEQAESAELLDEIKEELRDSGYMKRRLKKNPHKANRKNPVPLKYILQNGMTALVGKSNRCNDYLTTKLARKTDLWLHAKDIPGSHVILQLPEGINVEKLDAEIIYEAAAIAAYHSKAARSANVPVDYVTVRRIKKPSGAKPGMVIFTGNKTVYVNPREGNLSS